MGYTVITNTNWENFALIIQYFDGLQSWSFLKSYYYKRVKMLSKNRREKKTSCCQRSLELDFKLRQRMTLDVDLYRIRVRRAVAVSSIQLALFEWTPSCSCLTWEACHCRLDFYFLFFLSLSARPFSFISIRFVVFLLAFIIGSRYACVSAAAVLSWCVLLQLSLLLRGGRVLSRSIIRGCTQQRVSAEIEDAAWDR